MTNATKVMLSAAAGLLMGVALNAAQRRRMSFCGRVVVITGGSRGLGLVMARQLAREGARLVLLARDEDELERARDQIQALGADVMIDACDVGDPGEVHQAIDLIANYFGRIDVLINDAGLIWFGPHEHMEDEDLEQALAVHLWGSYYTMRAVVPHMKRQGGGRIVNIASIGGKVALPHLLPYNVSKFAQVGLSDTLRAELAQHNVRVTTVCPGLMRTGSHVRAYFKGNWPAEFAWFALAGSLPGPSIGAERAARQILEAARRGQPHLTVGWPARLVIGFGAAFPQLFAHLVAWGTRLMPLPTDAQGDRPRMGLGTRSRLAPSLLTRLSDRASVRNNEVPAG